MFDASRLSYRICLLSSSTTQTGSGWLSVMQRKISASLRVRDLGALHFGYVCADQGNAAVRSGMAGEQFPAPVDGLRLDRLRIALPSNAQRRAGELIRRFHGKAVEAF